MTPLILNENMVTFYNNTIDLYSNLMPYTIPSKRVFSSIDLL